MKKNLRFYLFLIVSVVGIAQPARAVSFELDGVITEFTVSGFPDLGISVGDKFHAQLTYAVSDLAFGGDGAPSDPSIGNYPIIGRGEFFLTLTVADRVFDSVALHPGSILVTDGVGGDSFEIRPGPEGTTGPWPLTFNDSSSTVRLSDPTGKAISSDAIPTELQLKSWEGDHYVTFSIRDVFGNSAFLKGDITKIKATKTEAVPDYAGTGALLTLALAILALISQGRQLVCEPITQWRHSSQR
jgi:hypothetical protein